MCSVATSIATQAFEKNHYQFYKYNGTFLIYSSIANLTITQPISFTGKTANYLFYISSQHEKKYSHFGFRRMINDVLGKIEIFDGQSYKLLYQNNSKEGHIMIIERANNE